MNAVVLLHTNSNFVEQGRTVIKSLTIKDVKISKVCHVFGRYDGVLFCESASLGALNALGEALRKGGVFDTETLIGIE